MLLEANKQIWSYVSGKKNSRPSGVHVRIFAGSEYGEETRDRHCWKTIMDFSCMGLSYRQFFSCLPEKQLWGKRYRVTLLDSG